MSEKIYRCAKGDVILHNGIEMWVSDVISQGKEDYVDKNGLKKAGTRAYIAACRIMPDNGQILKRSPICIDQKWAHITIN